MRVTVVDPPAYTPPYDHCLCSALAQRGVEVELATSRFRYGPVPEPRLYRRNECFYRRGTGSQLTKAVQHPLDMSRLARAIRRAPGTVTHFQWLPIPQLDRWLVRSFPRPRVLTAHDILPREAGEVQRRATRQLFTEMDAVIAHTRAGRERLIEFGVDGSRTHVIPHGAFDYLVDAGSGDATDPALSDLDGRMVVLFFGLLRPYKGIEVLIEAFARAREDAVLVIAGMPRMPVEPLREQAVRLGIADRVRFVARFVRDDEIAAFFARADLVVLPYRETEQSGVLFTTLAFAKPVIVSDVGGFSEVASEHAAAAVVPPGDVAALGDEIVRLLADSVERARLSAAAAAAAAGPYSWDRAAELTAELYRSLGAE